MKKILSLFLSLFAIIGIALSVSAAPVDVPDSYWASMEINAVLRDNIMDLYPDGKFYPEVSVKRVDFADWVLRALENNTFQITVPNNYSDVNEYTRGYETILRNDQLGLVYGYTDGEFKPERIITKAETNSIMSHITKNVDISNSVLGGFTDVQDIPFWALNTYEKTVRYGLYVNYPDLNEFLPNKDLNRAEAAVLLYKLRSALNLVKKTYQKEEEPRVEHLNVIPNPPANTVRITEQRILVDQGNVLRIAFLANFNSKKHKIGDPINFISRKDVYTEEGTLVFPKGTKFNAVIESLKDPKWVNRNAKMTINVKEAILPSGKSLAMNASAFLNEGVLESNYWEKPLWWTLAGTAVGAGVGVAAGAPNDHLGTGLAIGIPSGAAAGAGLGLLTPGVNFGATAGDEILILLNGPISIYKVIPSDEEYVTESEYKRD